VGLIYLDASVLLSLLIADANTASASAWYSGLRATVLVSDFANIEVSAVASRHLRVGRLTQRQVDGVLLDFDALRAGCERLTHSEADFQLAERLARDFSTKLAAPDALHLASAKNAGAALATFDQRLEEAARGQGVELALA
jgi:uncharacterized protein